jgi:RNA polymerase sigma-70 factor (ECF subfamily)
MVTTTTTSSAIRSEVTSVVERARGGDRPAFEALLDVRLAPAFRLAMAILGDEADARDAVQDAFIRAWRDLAGLRDAGRFDAWLDRILVNTCRTAARRRRRRAVHEIPVAALPAGGEGFDPPDDGGLPRASEAEIVARALDRLTVGERTLLALHHHEGLSLEEVGRRTGIPARTAKSRLFSARRALARALEEERR